MKLHTSILRNIIILALSASLVFMTQVSRFSIAAQSEQGNKYEDLLYGGDFDVNCETGDAEDREARDEEELDTDEVDEVIEKYHEMINCLFNMRIQKMVKTILQRIRLTEKDLKEIFVALSPPEFILNEEKQAVGRKPCLNKGDGMNISTYCLAQAATEEYMQFRAAMQKARQKEKADAAQQLFKDTGKSVDEAPDNFVQQRSLGGAIADIFQGEKALQDYGATINRIDDEMKFARTALDQSLAAYSELQMALPLHRKYKEIITTLEEYRDKVRDIRKEVDLYPVTFLDVTTTQCT